MQIESVNTGKARELKGQDKDDRTGIFKTPVSDAIEISDLGLAGDEIVDTRFHGGPDQAVYLYRQEDYDWWSEALEHTVAAGTFGENLTVSGLPSEDMAVGSRLIFSHVTLAITAPRIPCNVLAARMGDSKFIKRFMQAERPGAYCRVVSAGPIRTGETFEVDKSSASEVTIIEVFRAHTGKLTRAELERFLAAPIDIRTRTKWEKKLAALS